MKNQPGIYETLIQDKKNDWKYSSVIQVLGYHVGEDLCSIPRTGIGGHLCILQKKINTNVNAFVFNKISPKYIVLGSFFF